MCEASWELESALKQAQVGGVVMKTYQLEDVLRKDHLGPSTINLLSNVASILTSLGACSLVDCDTLPSPASSAKILQVRVFPIGKVPRINYSPIRADCSVFLQTMEWPVVCSNVELARLKRVAKAGGLYAELRTDFLGCWTHGGAAWARRSGGDWTQISWILFIIGIVLLIVHLVRGRVPPV